MRILVYRHDGGAIKQVFDNNSVNLGYTDLQYSSSLEGLGSCSFKLPKSDPRKFIGLNYYTEVLTQELIGLERVYLQDDNGNIVWGGINSTFDGDTEGADVKCIEMKSYFKTLSTSFTGANGNALVAIQSILTASGSDITLHEDSNIVDDVNVKIPSNATVYDAIKLIIEASYSRWILVHKKVNGLIETKLLCRSIIGVSPAGVGLDRSKDSDEVQDNEKVFYIYDEVNTERSNLVSYKASQKHESVVSNCIVQYKDAGGVEQSAQSQEPVGGEHNSPAVIEYFFGKNEKTITSLEIIDASHAQDVANREVQFSDTRVSVNLYPQAEDNVFVGDRVDFQIFSGSFVTGTIDGDGNYALSSSRWRVQEKTVRVGDGVLNISMQLSARNTVPYSFNLLEKIGENNKDARRINSNIISG